MRSNVTQSREFVERVKFLIFFFFSYYNFLFLYFLIYKPSLLSKRRFQIKICIFGNFCPRGESNKGNKIQPQKGTVLIFFSKSRQQYLFFQNDSGIKDIKVHHLRIYLRFFHIPDTSVDGR